jgi:hypothetical protein
VTPTSTAAPAATPLAPAGTPPAAVVDPAAKPADPAAAPKPAEVAAPVPLALTDIKVPEGYTLDPVLGADFLSVMNDAALTPADRVSKLVDLQTKIETAAKTNAAALFTTQQTNFRKEVETDPEVGGTNLPAVEGRIGNLLNRFGDAAVREAIELTGLGNRLPLVKFLDKIAKHIGEGGPVPPVSAGGGTVRTGPVTDAQLGSKLYDNPTSKK